MSTRTIKLFAARQVAAATLVERERDRVQWLKNAAVDSMMVAAFKRAKKQRARRIKARRS